MVGLVRPVRTDCCENVRIGKKNSEPTLQSSFNKMYQRLAVTYLKNERMKPHGINPILSIFLLTPSPVAMQGLYDTALYPGKN